MKKRVGVIVAPLLAGLLVLLVRRVEGPSDPVFEGRPLSSWLEHHVASSAADPPFGSPGWKKADDAIRRIGTNGIPTLVSMLRAKDKPRFVLEALELARRTGLMKTRYRYASTRHEEAEYAFQILGANAASAVPELVRTYEENISPSSRNCTALSLGHIGPAAQAALPTLIRDFTHTNRTTRFYAVSAVAQIGGRAEVVVPALTSALKDSNVNVRWNALSGLNRFGGRARSAVDEILKMTHDPGVVASSGITQEVAVALWRIAPEKIGKPLVVEDATPMIDHGTNTQALKVLSEGKRRTLIRAGRSVPAVAQYWNSDPRPALTLYRGSDASEDSDFFLGRFEVLGLEEREDLNVSTLCVLVDGQIILCARDNHRDVFLEIRRVDKDAPQ